jgi:hypothetical protein
MFTFGDGGSLRSAEQAYQQKRLNAGYCRMRRIRKIRESHKLLYYK